MVKKYKNKIVNVKEIANILNITDRRIQQLVSENIIIKESRGSYDLIKSVQNYIAYLVKYEKTRQCQIKKLKKEKLILKEKSDSISMENKILKNKINSISNIYILLDELNEVVKIGKTKNIDKRIKALQTSSPCKLKLLISLPENNQINEKRLHRKYQDKRIKGEWFKYDEEIKQEIINISNYIHKTNTFKKTNNQMLLF
jgi:hypothetical protein